MGETSSMEKSGLLLDVLPKKLDLRRPRGPLLRESPKLLSTPRRESPRRESPRREFSFRRENRPNRLENRNASRQNAREMSERNQKKRIASKTECGIVGISLWLGFLARQDLVFRQRT